MWTLHSDFLRVVKEAWEVVDHGDGLRLLQQKLIRVKAALKSWSRDTFGNIFAALDHWEDEVARAESNYETSPTDQN